MKKFIALLFICIYTVTSFACTTFLLSKNGQPFLGRNYDWVTGNGMVMLNTRDLVKTSLATRDGKTITWRSLFGSISFNQYGKEFPTGGMNEKGLVVELMWLNETEYPDADKRASIDVLQWIQYQLDCSGSIEEVINSESLLRITKHDPPLHYLVADASGKAATIEFLDGKMIVHRDATLPLPVLANSVYSKSVESLKNKKENQRSHLFTDNSLERFAVACDMVRKFQLVNNADPLDYAFTILDKVKQPDFTKWSIVYDITKRQIHFITNKNTRRATIHFKAFDFSCTTWGYTLSLDAKPTGDAFNKFTPLTFEANSQLLKQSVKESKPQIEILDFELEKAELYSKKIRCIK